MANELLHLIVQEALQEDINFNGLLVAVEQLVRPVDIVPNPREVPRRNENYYEEVIPRYTPDDFWCHFRMSRATFQLLLDQLPRGQDRQEHILVEKKLLFSMWMLAKPESFVAAGDRFDLAAGTGHGIFFEIINQICQLRHDTIVWPNQHERERISRELKNKSNIPGIIGAIDGCHIAMKAPPNNSVDYYNRNSYHSVVLQGVCNDKKEFIDVFAGTPGRVHDARVFRTSPIFNSLTEIEAEATISPTEHLLGDSAYPLSPFLLTPYRDNGHLTVSQVTFNTRMSSVRVLIEQAFGLLKCKFRRLKYLDMARIDMIPAVVVAACVLHNIILRNDGIVENQHYDQPEAAEQDNINIDINEYRNRNVLGERKRDFIATLLTRN